MSAELSAQLSAHIDLLSDQIKLPLAAVEVKSDPNTTDTVPNTELFDESEPQTQKNPAETSRPTSPGPRPITPTSSSEQLPQIQNVVQTTQTSTPATHTSTPVTHTSTPYPISSSTSFASRLKSLTISGRTQSTPTISNKPLHSIPASSAGGTVRGKKRVVRYYHQTPHIIHTRINYTHKSHTHKQTNPYTHKHTRT